MPFPIIWAAVAVGGAALAWINRKAIKDFFDSEAGQKLLVGLTKVMEGQMQPTRNLLDRCLNMPPDERKLFLMETKRRVSMDDWIRTVEYSKGIGKLEPKYMSAILDVLYVDGMNE